MINILQVVISIILIILILLQEKSSGLSGVFGGGSSADSSYQTRRGFDKFLFWGTIITGTVFVLLSLADLLLF